MSLNPLAVCRSWSWHAPIPALRDVARHEAEWRATAAPRGVLDPDLLRAALPNAIRKLDPRLLIKNPVMFVVEITAALVTLILIGNVTGLQSGASTSTSGFQLQIAIWLWFTVLFATYAEAVAEARGRAQAATLRKTRTETTANRRKDDGSIESVGIVRAAQGRHHRRRGRPDHPRRRRRHRGRWLRQRGRHHGRVGAGPQGAWHGHPLVGDRRHDARQRQARRSRHRRSGRDVPGPNDCPGRGRQAPAHAERDRPGHPARGPDDRFPDGHGHASAVRSVSRARPSTRSPSSPCSCVSFRPLSAACCPRSASPAWIAWRASTCWP